MDRLACPDPPHHIQVPGQQFEPRVKVHLHRIEVVPGRAAADSKTEPTLRQRSQGQCSVGMLDRMAQRHLHHAGAQFNARRLCRQRPQQDQRIERRLAARQGIGHPQAVKSQLFHLAGNGGDVLDNVGTGFAGLWDGDDTDSHTVASPGELVNQTRPIAR
jgi:hypothetical protein